MEQKFGGLTCRVLNKVEETLAKLETYVNVDAPNKCQSRIVLAQRIVFLEKVVKNLSSPSVQTLYSNLLPSELKSACNRVETILKATKECWRSKLEEQLDEKEEKALIRHEDLSAKVGQNHDDDTCCAACGIALSIVLLIALSCFCLVFGTELKQTNNLIHQQASILIQQQNLLLNQIKVNITALQNVPHVSATDFRMMHLRVERIMDAVEHAEYQFQRTNLKLEKLDDRVETLHSQIHQKTMWRSSVQPFFEKVCQMDCIYQILIYCNLVTIPLIGILIKKVCRK